MRFLRRLIGFLLILVVVLIGVAFVMPSHWHVERSTTIARPPSEVFGLLNGYRRFNEWSPWAAKDPNAKYTFSGPATGVGAKQSWVGDPKTVGSGSQEIVESKPFQSITTALDFGDMGKSTARFQLTPEGQGTKLTWSLDSDNAITLDGKFLFGVIGRYMAPFMEKMIAPDYEAGLAKLKALAETLPNIDIAGIDPQMVELAPRKILYVSGTTTMEPEVSKTALTNAYGAIGVYMAANKLTMSAAPLTITNSYDGKSWGFDAGIPAEYTAAPEDSAVMAGTTPAGKAVQLTHTGAYDQIGGTIEKAYAWIAVQGMKPRERMVEDYIDDPGSVPVEKRRTLISIPVQ
jgi:effector-binding domain-containing protein/carbon monoxide dehydrogenase subunit G